MLHLQKNMTVIFFSGPDCERDFDGCAANPCSLGRNCTDVPAEQYINTADSPTYHCAPCPEGFNDDGETCRGLIVFV